MQDGDPALAVEAAIRADVHELIGRLPEGYSTWIGGAGYALSGGQQQRVALARALYGQPKLLILDEPNSNLDHIGEQALVGAIAQAKREGAAILLITHRPAVLAAVDRILTLKDGSIAAAPALALAPLAPDAAGDSPDAAFDARGQLASA
jgi:ATP-binding cassette subfamily C protein